ncbi:MAG TPA: 23S rRNA (guanosine(2251)-2'-O)-methyltransferase RlmB [Vicinamibacterales bacterium]|nr:23S rRNA (guanosine(2251)-2'-O)-methyltransferase RlmB [Vicinamibacterales bacterium]
MIVYGLNPVIEALRAGRASEVRVTDRGGAVVREVLRIAEREHVPVRRVAPGDLDRIAHGGVHQGVAATVRDAPGRGVEDLLRGARGAPLLVVLDGIEDPQNLGAILRSVDAAGADGVVRQTRHAAALGGAAAKASAGAVAHVPVADVVNIARTLETLKAAGVWTVGLAADAPRRYDEMDLTLPTALVVGAEGAGLRRLVRERCDWLASIPMAGHVGSLNVSVAAAVVLFEAVRQRRQKALQ